MDSLVASPNNNSESDPEGHKPRPQTTGVVTAVENNKITFPNPAFSYVNHKLKVKKTSGGLGLFATTFIPKDELLVYWAGKIVHVQEVLAMRESERTYILQVEEELFQVPFWAGYNEPADFVNHSCDPTAGFRNSPVCLVAMRDLKVGEEVTFDYAMAECIENIPGNDGFDCCCGTQFCRGKFMGKDWKRPELWARYGKYFSPYLYEKIRKLQMMTHSNSPSSFGSSTPDISTTPISSRSPSPLSSSPRSMTNLDSDPRTNGIHFEEIIKAGSLIRQ